MFDLISFGDATIDMFLTISEANVHCNLKSERCELCLSYADKIPVDAVERIDGAGNASNNAVGATRLGLHTAIVSTVGNDGTGEGIVRHWQDAGVATNFVTIDHARGTNYSTVINFKGERTILVYHEPRDYRFPEALPAATWAYYTSLAAGSEVLHAPLLAWVRQHGVKLLFQPGTFQLKMGKEAIAPLIGASEITIMNKEEAERIVGEGNDMGALLAGLRALGAKTAVITDGPKGSCVDDGTQRLSLGIYDVPAVERTGCGDAYATGLMAALSQGLPMSEAMRWGTVNSASVLGHVGPQKGLLTRAQMDEWLQKYPTQPAQF
jgi:ribokinase